MEFLSEYDLKIKHIKGKENQVADAINMRAHEVHVGAINMYKKNLKDQIIPGPDSDHKYVK
jgi:hypothetical protein